MNLSTLFFVFAFLPVSLILYLLCPRVCKNALLILVSFLFYAWGSPVYLLLLLLVLVIGGVLLVRRSLAPAADSIPVPDYVQQDLLTVNPYSRPGDELKTIRGVVIHYVGNPGTSAQANRNYFESLSAGTDGTYASSHFVVGLEVEVIQCVPLTEIAYASNSRNEDTVSIEVCHPDETGEFGPETYESVVRLTAWLCETFHLDPESDVIRHYDVTGKYCPRYYVENEDAWAALRSDVSDRIAQDQAAAS